MLTIIRAGVCLQPFAFEGGSVEYPICLNGNCVHNDEYLCRADGLGEDIICLQGKADAIKELGKRPERKLVSSGIRFQPVVSSFC